MIQCFQNCDFQYRYSCNGRIVYIKKRIHEIHHLLPQWMSVHSRKYILVLFLQYYCDDRVQYLIYDSNTRIVQKLSLDKMESYMIYNIQHLGEIYIANTSVH